MVKGGSLHSTNRSINIHNDQALKYIPGSQNIPADLLSREPFAKGIRITDPGNKANHMSLESIQNAFNLSVNSQEQHNGENECGVRQEVGREDVKALSSTA